MINRNNNYKQLIDFFVLVGRLKKIERKGWVLRIIKNPESVADHTFRTMAMVVFLAENRNIDIIKVFKMALIHDLAETMIGDWTPYDNVLKDKKQPPSVVLKKWVGNEYVTDKLKNEKIAFKNIVKILPQELRQSIENEYEEFLENKSEEAQFVNQIDKLEMLLQALEYKREGNEFAIEPFWEDVRAKIKDMELRRIFDELKVYFTK